MRHEVEPQEAEADNHKGSLTAGGDSISSDYHGHLTNACSFYAPGRLIWLAGASPSCQNPLD